MPGGGECYTILVTCLNPLISHTKKLTLRGDTNLPSGHRVDGQIGFHQGCLIPKPMSLTTSLLRNVTHTIKKCYNEVLKTYCSEKKKFLPNYESSWTRHLVTQKLWWRCTRLLWFSCVLTWHPFWQPMDQGVFSPFKSYYLRNILYKSMRS